MNIRALVQNETEIEMIEILSMFINLNESFFSKKTLQHLKEMLEVIKNDELTKE